MTDAGGSDTCSFGNHPASGFEEASTDDQSDAESSCDLQAGLAVTAPDPVLVPPCFLATTVPIAELGGETPDGATGQHVQSPPDVLEEQLPFAPQPPSLTEYRAPLNTKADAWQPVCIPQRSVPLKPFESEVWVVAEEVKSALSALHCCSRMDVSWQDTIHGSSVCTLTAYMSPDVTNYKVLQVMARAKETIFSVVDTVRAIHILGNMRAPFMATQRGFFCTLAAVGSVGTACGGDTYSKARGGGFNWSHPSSTVTLLFETAMP